MSSGERLSVPRGSLTKETSRFASLSTGPPSRRPSPKLTSIPTLPSANQSSREKTSVPNPLKIVERLKGGKLMDGRPASVTLRSTTANKLPPRPSCIPRFRVCDSAFDASKAKQDVTVKVSTTGPRNPQISPRMPSINIREIKNVGCVMATDTSVNTPIVPGSCRARVSTRKRRLRAPTPIIYPQDIPDVAWSPPPSPVLSSFPSQTWTIVVDETLSNTPKSGVVGMPKDSCGPSEAVSPLTLSPTLTVIDTLPSTEGSTVESDGMAMVSSPTKGPSAEVSHTVCAATIISPSRTGTASSMATLAKVMDNQTSSPTGVGLEFGNKTQTTVQCAIEIAKTIFSPSRRASQYSTKTAAPPGKTSLPWRSSRSW